MMERRLLMGMAGIVFAILSALALQVVAESRMPLGETAPYGNHA